MNPLLGFLFILTLYLLLVLTEAVFSSVETAPFLNIFSGGKIPILYLFVQMVTFLFISAFSF